MSTATLTEKDVRVRDAVLAVTGSVAPRVRRPPWLQRDAAERAAYDAPGITMVDNQIVVDPPDDDTCEIC